MNLSLVGDLGAAVNRSGDELDKSLRGGENVRRKGRMVRKMFRLLRQGRDFRRKRWLTS